MANRRHILKAFQVIVLTLLLSIVYFSRFQNKLRNAEEFNLKSSTVAFNYAGEMGAAVHLPLPLSKRIKQLVTTGWQNHKFNQFVSDLISINRSLPDVRDKWCKKSGYFPKNLPVTDVIICFHNEAWSTLLRTVHSVINRSPEYLIKQIILVDDCSNATYLKKPLSRYFSKFPKVKIVRALKRQGIARARLIGMKYSTAPILTYLDSHCECMEGWLEPLLERIANSPSTIVAPFIDTIDETTFEYFAPTLRGERIIIGGFNWNLEYTWSQRPERNNMEPYATPTIAGGLFSVDRKFFEHLGTYDLGFVYWGGENLELSFKTWMCGGRLEIVYCSRVGHVFRNELPYRQPFADAMIVNNLIRLADAWLDDYAKIFYASMGLKFNVTAALSNGNNNKLLRKKLGCKSFQWYLENIYPEKFVPVAFGSIVQIRSNLCLDAKDVQGNVNIIGCHNRGANQFWMIGNLGEIRKDDNCLTISQGKPILTPCTENSKNSHWLFNKQTQQILSERTRQCLTLSNNGSKIFMKKCQSSNWRQHWMLKK